MVTLPSLWLPILLSGVFVFVGSSVIHMFLSYHKNDFRELPDEDAAMNALRPLSIPPGDYVMPYAGGSEHLKSDAFKAKVEKGPVAVMTVYAPGDFFNMGPQLAKWFAYCVLVGATTAYVAKLALAPGAEYMEVFRLTGTVAFLCYAMALPQRSIWYKQNWSSTLKSMFDGFLYGLLTAGAFGTFWP